MSNARTLGATIGAVVLLCGNPVAPVPASGLDLEQVLVEFDRVQESIKTLSAEFTETVHSTLLKEDIVAEGKVYLTKPDAVRWEYSVPEEMRFVISNDKYTGYFPERKQAEKRDIRRWGEQLFRLMGLGQASAELAQFYTIRLAEAQPEGRDELCLELDPIKKRVRKRMEAVNFCMDPTTYLPLRVEYRSKKGNRRLIEFQRVTVNPEIAANLYEVELPPDVNVTKGFSALSGFTSSSGN